MLVGAIAAIFFGFASPLLLLVIPLVIAGINMLVNAINTKLTATFLLMYLRQGRKSFEDGKKPSYSIAERRFIKRANIDIDKIVLNVEARKLMKENLNEIRKIRAGGQNFKDIGTLAAKVWAKASVGSRKYLLAECGKPLSVDYFLQVSGKDTSKMDQAAVNAALKPYLDRGMITQTGGFITITDPRLSEKVAQIVLFRMMNLIIRWMQKK